MKKHGIPILIIICSLAISAFVILNSRNNRIPKEANLPYEPYVVLAERIPISAEIRDKIESTVKESVQNSNQFLPIKTTLINIEEIYPVKYEGSEDISYYAKINILENDRKETYYYIINDLGGCRKDPCEDIGSENYDSSLSTGDFRVKDIGSARDMEVKFKD